MPNKELLRQLEIEKQRRSNNRTTSGATEQEMHNLLGREHKYAYEYELEAYRSQQKKAKWLMGGAICGVISLVLEVVFHWGDVAALWQLWVK